MVSEEDYNIPSVNHSLPWKTNKKEFYMYDLITIVTNHVLFVEKN